jgi:arylsulfatase
MRTIAILALLTATVPASAQSKRPNIVMLISDDTGWGDLGVYGGGEGRGAATPSFDRMAREGLTFWSFYGQPSCTPGRAALQTGRNPNRSGMTTVAFPGQGGGLPKEEWTLASVLKNAGYQTAFFGKWHLGEADYALPIAHGYDVMKNVTLYHLNAYTYADPTFNPDMPPELRATYAKALKGLMEGEAGKPAREVRKIDSKNIPLLDQGAEEAALAYLSSAARNGKPFFISLNFAKNHQPNLPHPDFVGKSAAKTKYADSLVELDARVGHVLDRLRQLGIADNTLVFYTVDNGAWQDVYPDCGYTPFRGTKGTVREGGNRVPAIAWWPGKIKPGTSSHDIAGGLDLMATFAALAGTKLPETDRAGKPIIFDSYDLSPVLFGSGHSQRRTWFYFTEDELTPGAVRVGRWKAVFNLRGDDGATNGGLEVGTNEGWKGPSKYVAAVPRIYDLWQDPQERYDIFMTNWVEKTWALPLFNEATKKLMKSYMQYPPRKQQSETYQGPVTLPRYERFENVRQHLQQSGIDVPLPN